MSKKHIKKPLKATHIKDPKKVLAGKARASQAIRIDGKLTTNDFLQSVREDAARAGVKDPFKYFLNNEIKYTQEYKALDLQPYKNFERIDSVLKQFKGKTFLNGKAVNRGEFELRYAELTQMLKSEFDVVEASHKIRIGLLSRNIAVELPTVEELQDFMESVKDEDEKKIAKLVAKKFGIHLIISRDKDEEESEEYEPDYYDPEFEPDIDFEPDYYDAEPDEEEEETEPEPEPVPAKPTKDPKKVAAGQARAAKAKRDKNGRFIKTS